MTNQYEFTPWQNYEFPGCLYDAWPWDDALHEWSR